MGDRVVLIPGEYAGEVGYVIGYDIASAIEHEIDVYVVELEDKFVRVAEDSMIRSPYQDEPLEPVQNIN